mgnify:CR=1 FL=1
MGPPSGGLGQRGGPVAGSSGGAANPMALVGHSIRVWQADKGDWVVGDVTVRGWG